MRVQQSGFSRVLAKIPNNYNTNFGERLRALALLNSPLLLTEKEDKLAQNSKRTNIFLFNICLIFLAFKLVFLPIYDMIM